MSQPHEDDVKAVVTPVVEQAGFDLEELTVIKAGRRLLVRVLIDGDGGVTLDDIAEVSREASKALDAGENTGGLFAEASYTLEVSSPGVDRPLTLPRHWRRNIGRLVEVSLGGDKVQGRIVAADERGIELEVAGRVRAATFAELGAGKVHIEMQKSAKANKS
ncbi:ribosome maturation factor RimP [Natronoglycomyces albus]|uniref:Ribosome maturation factor RimP n=1 Tax=Natronoglycomyces albus TaxID=2811108 RepID=A0A895XLM9_9ACTN|nr:ribosome maturation factor RimP [Natronoglycomyces albus]QSB06244.1 ribosome maturation factor RimP [Natronoglycomyces albus]